MISAVLAIVPANCYCRAAIGQLLEQAESVGVIVYLVGPRRSQVADLDRLVTPARKNAVFFPDSCRVVASSAA